MQSPRTSDESLIRGSDSPVTAPPSQWQREGMAQRDRQRGKQRQERQGGAKHCRPAAIVKVPAQDVPKIRPLKNCTGGQSHVQRDIHGGQELLGVTVQRQSSSVPRRICRHTQSDDPFPYQARSVSPPTSLPPSTGSISVASHKVNKTIASRSRIGRSFMFKSWSRCDRCQLRAITAWPPCHPPPPSRVYVARMASV